MKMLCITTQEQLTSLKDQRWCCKAWQPVLNSQSDSTLESLLQVTLEYRGDYRDTTLRTAGYVVGAPFVLAGSFFCSAFSCCLSALSSKKRYIHVQTTPLSTSQQAPLLEPVSKTIESTEATAQQLLEWNRSFFQYSQPFQFKTYYKTVFVEQETLRAVFSNISVV